MLLSLLFAIAVIALLKWIVLGIYDTNTDTDMLDWLVDTLGVD